MANSYGTATALSGNANSLANGAYASLGVIDFGAAPAHECFVEVSLQASTTVSGNKQALIFARNTLDGTNYSDATASGTEQNSKFLGVIALQDTSAHRSSAMSIAAAFGGGLPPKVEIYVKNDCGVALASSGQVGQYITETFG